MSLVTCPRFEELRQCIADACLAIHRPTRDSQHAWTGKRASGGGCLQLAKSREARQVTRRSHNANASHAMCREERQLEQRRIPAEAEVGVHIPQARDEVLACAVDDTCICRDAHPCRRRNADNVITLHQDCLVSEQSSPLDIDNSDMSDREIGFGDGFAARCGGTAGEQGGDARRQKTAPVRAKTRHSFASMKWSLRQRASCAVVSTSYLGCTPDVARCAPHGEAINPSARTTTRDALLGSICRPLSRGRGEVDLVDGYAGKRHRRQIRDPDLVERTARSSDADKRRAVVLRVC